MTHISDRLLYVLFGLAALIALPDILALFELFYHPHPYTEMEEIPVFYGLYSMTVFFLLIAVAKGVQTFLARKEDYYD
ncbi:hypothetical protein [Sneathiella sp.]|jgi:uncharacterized membrane protein|uniref:hypothetical protein n=1 Tax=Sneathiella sp. TaxID=1964365 RepID=UPI0039E47206